jgi:hypothetical protein
LSKELSFMGFFSRGFVGVGVEGRR